jgi:pSer/pThr/pTyr-binding forkhead associated (FHA) protein
VDPGGEVAPAPGSDQQPPALRVRLRLANGRIFELAGRSTYVIGRRDSSGLAPDVDLADWNGAAGGVSRRHALVHVIGPTAYIEDLQSRNQTVRNGSRLLPGRRYPLAHGDRLRLGLIELFVVLG